MPADFTPLPQFVWHPRTKSKRRPKKAKKSKRRTPRQILTAHLRTILADRIEAATADGRILPEEIAPLYDRLFAALFPEDYGQPRRPAAPTTTAPGSAARAEEYKSRQRRGEDLYHPQDPDPDERRHLLGKKLPNGIGLVIGWHGQRADNGSDSEVGNFEDEDDHWPAAA